MSNLKTCLRTSFLVSLLLSFTLNSFANDSERITQLEKEVMELKQRLSKLEAMQNFSLNQQIHITTSEGWKSLASWRSLKKGMSYDEVRAILGEPARVKGGDFTMWLYPNRSYVDFYKNKLQSWSEPM